jgi:hypothetical protein
VSLTKLFKFGIVCKFERSLQLVGSRRRVSVWTSSSVTRFTGAAGGTPRKMHEESQI